jgi:hypothetical protein
MAGLEDALANQAIINHGNGWIDPLDPHRPKLSEVDYESSLYKRFGYEMDEARRMQEEYARRRLVEEARKKREEELKERHRHETLERALDRITKDAKMMDRDSEEDLVQLNKRKMRAFYDGNLDDVDECERMMDKIKEKYNKNKLTKKEDATMANENNTKNKMTINTKIDVNAILQAKMAEKMMDAVGNGKDIPLTKMTIMQGITTGKGIDINEIIQAKQTEKLLKDLDSGKELTIGKLLTYQALTQGDGFDLNALIQAKFVEKLFDEDEKTAK